MELLIQGRTERRTLMFFTAFFVLVCLDPSRCGVHNNYFAFDSGVGNILAGLNPYPKNWGTAQYPFPPWYLYSPTFAYFFLPFSNHGVGPMAGQFLWAFLNYVCLVSGVLAVFGMIDTGKRFKGRWFFALLFFMANEMIGSFTNLQSNGFIGGLCLLGTALYIGGRPFAAALLLAMATNFKLYPLALGLLLCLEFNVRFIAAYVMAVAIFFLIPLFFLPPENYGGMLNAWFDIILHEPVHKEYLGIEPTLLYFFGTAVLPGGGGPLMLLNAAALAAASFFVFKRDRKEFLSFILPAVLGFVALFNKRAESQSLVLVAPVFGYALYAALVARHAGRRLGWRIHLTVLIVCWMLISWVHSDLAPHSFRKFADTWRFKTAGILFLYLWSWARIAEHFFFERSEERALFPKPPIEAHSRVPSQMAP